MSCCSPLHLLLACCLAAGLSAADPFPERPLDEALAGELGAACLLPADVAGFSATHDLDGQTMAFWTSAGVQSLLRSPAGMMGWMQLVQHPAYQQALRFAHAPQGRELLAALHQLIDQEVFVAMGADAGPRLEAVIDVYNDFYLDSLIAGFEAGMEGRELEDPPLGALVAALAAHEQDLRLPSMLIGARLRQPERVQALIDQWLPPLLARLTVGSYQPPVPGADWSHRLVVLGAELLAEGGQELLDEALREGLRASEVATLGRLLAAQRIELELTLRDGYLLLSLGADRGLITAWAPPRAESLAAAEVFRPVRSLHRPGLAAVSYLSPALANLGGLSPETCERLAREASDYIGGSPHIEPDLRQRLLADIPALCADLAAQLPTPGARIRCSYREQGLRSWSVDHGANRRLGSGASRLHALAGVAPLFACSAAGRDDSADYQVLSRWTATGFDYLRRGLLQQLQGDERAQGELVLGAVADFGRALDRALVQDLLPAFGPAAESLLVVEAGGRLEGLPPELGLVEGVALPRAALVVALDDREALLRGVGRVVAAVEALGAALAELPGSEIPPGFSLPAPTRDDADGASRFHYPELAIYGPDLQPVALLADDLLVIGSSQSQLAELLARRGGEQAALARGAEEGLRLSLDVAGWSGFLLEVASELIDQQVAERRLRGREAGDLMMVLTHLQILDRALQSIAGLSMSVRAIPGGTVTETWLKTAP